MGPDKRFLKLCDTRLAFSIEIPNNYILDNDVFAKMIETTEIVVNHESITRKSTPLDNSVTNAIFNKLTLEAGLLNTSLATHGIFSARDVDIDQIKPSDVSTRDKNATAIIKEITIDDQIYLVPYKQYYFVANINHGIAREFSVLPAEIPYRFRFHRARSEYLLLKKSPTVQAATKDEPNKKIELNFSYPETVVPFINPVLRCYYAYSSALSATMSRISTRPFELSFKHYDCKQQILDTALEEYVIPLGQGPLPQYIAFALSSLERTRGNDNESLTRFMPYDLTQFDLMLSKSLTFF